MSVTTPPFPLAIAVEYLYTAVMENPLAQMWTCREDGCLVQIPHLDGLGESLRASHHLQHVVERQRAALQEKDALLGQLAEANGALAGDNQRLASYVAMADQQILDLQKVNTRLNADLAKVLIQVQHSAHPTFMPFILE